MELLGTVFIIFIISFALILFTPVRNIFERLISGNTANTKQVIRAPIIRNEIREKVEFIYKRLKDLNIPLRTEYTVDPGYKRNIRKKKYSDESLGSLAKDMLKSIGVTSAKFSIFIHNEYMKEQKEGRNRGLQIFDRQVYDYGFYKTDSRGWTEVHITKKAEYGIKEIAAIIAHECVRYFLMLRKNDLPEIHENRFYTDITAVCLGFSNILIEGYRSRRRLSFERMGEDLDKQVKIALADTYATSNEIVYITNKISRLRIADNRELVNENRKMTGIVSYDKKMTALTEDIDIIKKTYDSNRQALINMIVKINESPVVSVEEDKILKKVKKNEVLSFSAEIHAVYSESLKIKGADDTGYGEMKKKTGLMSQKLNIWVRMLKKYDKISAPINDF